MNRRGYIAMWCAGGIMVLIGLAMDLTIGVSLPGGSIAFGVLTALVVVFTGQQVSRGSQPRPTPGPTDSTSVATGG